MGYQAATQPKCDNAECQRLRPNIAAMTNIDLPNDEYAPVVAAVRRVLDEDKFPMSPRLGPLKAALVRWRSSIPPSHRSRSSSVRRCQQRRCLAGLGTGRGGDDLGTITIACPKSAPRIDMLRSGLQTRGTLHRSA